jgi:hypothetical protein
MTIRAIQVYPFNFRAQKWGPWLYGHHYNNSALTIVECIWCHFVLLLNHGLNEPNPSDVVVNGWYSQPT